MLLVCPVAFRFWDTSNDGPYEAWFEDINLVSEEQQEQESLALNQINSSA